MFEVSTSTAQQNSPNNNWGKIFHNFHASQSKKSRFLPPFLWVGWGYFCCLVALQNDRMRQTILLRYLRCDWSDLRLWTALDQSQSSKEKTCWHEIFKKSSWGISKYGRRQERFSAGRLETLEGVLFLQSAKKSPKRHLRKLHRKGASIFMQFNMFLMISFEYYRVKILKSEVPGWSNTGLGWRRYSQHSSLKSTSEELWRTEDTFEEVLA